MTLCEIILEAMGDDGYYQREIADILEEKGLNRKSNVVAQLVNRNEIYQYQGKYYKTESNKETQDEKPMRIYAQISLSMMSQVEDLIQRGEYKSRAVIVRAALTLLLEGFE